MQACPSCHSTIEALRLVPMSFVEIDEAQTTASILPASLTGRGRKRKSGSLESSGSEDPGSEQRTGRWSPEEMTYCDKLIEKFESGELPIEEGVKLNEFLGNMLNSKQSRITKKMKNAKLSTRLFKRSSGFLQLEDARNFAALEDAFFTSIQDLQERAEIKFHVRKEWRSQFGRICLSIGQPLYQDDWLNSVEEMDRRASRAKNEARATKRRLMFGFALRQDASHPDVGVFIEKTPIEEKAFAVNGDGVLDVDYLLEAGRGDRHELEVVDMDFGTSVLQSSPYLLSIQSYMKRFDVPFEHVDLWVPSFVPEDGGTCEDSSSCRLFFAGSSTADFVVSEDSKVKRDITSEEQFNYNAFGDYSQKFSFSVGCGFPGRIYENGRPSWEQCVQNAPQHHFERCGGASQWGIKTVVGIPVASPSVGRIVVVFYSCFDRSRDEELVARLSDELTKV